MSLLRDIAKLVFQVLALLLLVWTAGALVGLFWLGVEMIAGR